MDHIEKEKRKVNPKEKASIFSVLSFFYTIDLFKKGFKRDLEEKDLYEVITTFRSKRLGDRLEEEWEKQKQRRKKKNLSICRLLLSVFGPEYFLIGVIQLIVKIALVFIEPNALGKLIKYFQPNQTELTKQDAYFYASLVIGVNLVHCIYIHNYYLIVTGLGIQIRTAFCSFIYRKTLKLSPAHLGDISIGKIVTLISKDVNSFEMFVHFANEVWIGIVKTAVVCYVIYDRIGMAAWTGVGFFFIVLPFQIYLGTWASKIRMKMCKRTDERLQGTQETLSAIRIIKMYTWERFFQDRITETRRKEVNTLHKNFYLRLVVLTIGTLNAKVAFYLLIMTYVWLGNHITAEIVYFILSCFHILTHTLSVMFPLGITQASELFASIKRIGNVLKALEVQESTSHQDITIKPKIVFKNATVDFKGKEILRSVDLSFDMGVNLVTGPVGSGKSFLLKTILRDFEPVSGGVVTHGRVSYASQEPWLFPSSIKQNIVFGERYDEKRYQEVLDVCALRYDLELLASGDNTIVEDRGINLSKGQQARINLARAVYKDSEIYLLDDCLSALDANVSDFIFDECIMKFLRNKLVILVTHNTNHLKDVDNVIILNDGKVKAIPKTADINEFEVIKEIESAEAQQKLKQKSKEEEGDVDEAAGEEEEADDVTNEDTKLITETTKERKVYQEVQKKGDVNIAVYKKYIRFGGGLFWVFAVFLVFVSAQFTISYTDKLVSKWVNIEQEISNFSYYNKTEDPKYSETIDRRDGMLQLYSAMIGISTLLTLARSFALFTFVRKASINLHRYMITNIINATMFFFDSNFIGNILNRFSKDLNTIDEHLPYIFYHLFRVLLILIGIISLIASVNLIFLLPTVIFLALLVVIRRAYLPTGRSLKRLDASTRSPVVGHLNATLEGLTTIRAFKAENILRDEFDRHQDLYTSATYAFQSSMRAFAYFMDTLCSFFIAIIVVRFLVADRDTLAGNVGLAISQAFLMTGTLQWGIRQWAEVENQMTSVERVLEYTEVRQENRDGLQVKDWPQEGQIEYKNVNLTYPNSEDKVLKNINFVAKPRQKIGVVGRTGAGKSSIISTLFRLYDVDGKITIDGVDTKTVSLDYLRKHISIIPQDPVLFSGTIRSNIDPIGEYSDDQIWKAVETANLKSLVPSLDFEISENGSNFSVGQRQLICMARAVIRNNRIIVLDEATANMDPETDAMIHSTIDNNFKNCTVFTIAHKLHSMLKCDKVMVLDKGEIIELDHPDILLENKDGVFYKLVKKSGLLPRSAQS